MHSPFDRLTQASVDHPRAALALALLALLLLGAAIPARFTADNSEDAFFPDNDETRLLLEVEATYSSEVDLVTVIQPLVSGTLRTPAGWHSLAEVEATLLEHPAAATVAVPLFGGSPSTGPASSAILWTTHVDPTTDEWSDGFRVALDVLASADAANLSTAVNDTWAALATVPMVQHPSAAELRAWSPTDPASDAWLDRLDGGQNRTGILRSLTGRTASLSTDRPPEQLLELGPLQGALFAALAPHLALNEQLDRTALTAAFPADTQTDPWSDADLALLRLAVSTDPVILLTLPSDLLPDPLARDLASEAEAVREAAARTLVRTWTTEIEAELAAATAGGRHALSVLVQWRPTRLLLQPLQRRGQRRHRSGDRDAHESRPHHPRRHPVPAIPQPA